MRKKFNESPPRISEAAKCFSAEWISTAMRRVTSAVLAASMMLGVIGMPGINSSDSFVADSSGSSQSEIFDNMLRVHAKELTSSGVESSGDQVQSLPKGAGQLNPSAVSEIATYAGGATGGGSGDGGGVTAGTDAANKVADLIAGNKGVNNIIKDVLGLLDWYSKIGYDMVGDSHASSGSPADMLAEFYEFFHWYDQTSKNYGHAFGGTESGRQKFQQMYGIYPDMINWSSSDLQNATDPCVTGSVGAFSGNYFDATEFGNWPQSELPALDQRDFFENFLLAYLEADAGIMDTYDLYAESKTNGGLINKEEDINFDEIKEYLVAIRPLMPWKPMNATHNGKASTVSMLNREDIIALAPTVNGSKCQYCYKVAARHMSTGMGVAYNHADTFPEGRQSGCQISWEYTPGGYNEHNYHIYFPLLVPVNTCGPGQDQIKEYSAKRPVGEGTPPEDWDTPPSGPEDSNNPSNSGNNSNDPNNPSNSGDNSNDPNNPSNSGDNSNDPNNPSNGGGNSPIDPNNPSNSGDNNPSNPNQSQSGDMRPPYSSDGGNSGNMSGDRPSNSNSGEMDSRPEGGGNSGGMKPVNPPGEDIPSIDIEGEIKWPYTVCNCGGPCPGDGAERGVACSEAGGQQCQCGSPKHTEKKGCNGSCGSKCDGSKDKCACPCDETIEWEPKPPTSTSEYDELRIESKVLVANFIQVWDKENPDAGNKFATAFENIQDIEKHEDVPGCFSHNYSTVSVSHNTCGQSSGCAVDEDGNRYHDCLITAPQYISYYCHSQYKFVWTKDPITQLDEKELKMVPNMMYFVAPQTTDSGAMIANKYVMTRKGLYPDYEFIGKGRVFDQYQFYNTNAWGSSDKVTIQNTHAGQAGIDVDGNPIGPTWIESYIRNYTRLLQPKNPTPAEPFKDPFTVSFLSHRFAKYMTEDIEGEVGRSKVLPLAGYMEPTQGNKDYKTFTEPRDIYRRVEWYLDEKLQENLDAMHKGTEPEGFNVRWGHGGDWGTNTGAWNADLTGTDGDSKTVGGVIPDHDKNGSDQIWNNEFSWTRVIMGPDQNPSHYNWCDVGGCTFHTHGSRVNTCPHHNTSNQYSGVADQLKTPRAEFLRTMIIEDKPYGQAKTCEADGFEYYARENEYGNDRITWHIPSTVFDFSPTYKMYADYGPDGNPEDYHDVWMLASDAETLQFNDVVDLNITGGDVVVRSNWSRDFEDTNVKDPNRGVVINVLKAGNAYWVETTDFRMDVTAVVHYWDENFWEPGSGRYTSAVADNQIVDMYSESLNAMMSQLDNKHFVYYTNLVGGTSGSASDITSNLRKNKQINPKIFNAEPESYQKLLLNPQIDGYGSGYSMSGMSVKSDNRLDGLVGGWDSTWAQQGGQTEWNEGIYQAEVPDDAIHSNENLESVLTSEDWYIEDYEAIKIKVLKGSVSIDNIKSLPAQVWERLSDSRTDTNKWSPEMRHYLAERGPGEQPSVAAGRVLIEEGSVGVGTEVLIPTFTVYPDGVKGGGTDVHDFSMMLYPDVIGLRGSTFDN